MLSAITRDPGYAPTILRVADELTPSPSDSSPDAPALVQFDPLDPLCTARAIKLANESDITIIQHEYGIFPGPDGDSILSFCRSVRSPQILIIHTVLSDPSSHQRAVLEELMTLAGVIVVPSNAAKTQLLATHPLDPDTITVISHGATPNHSALLEYSPAHPPTVLTWGLIGPGKGLATAIRALALVRELPLAHYVIAGATHPKVLAHTGESYRDSLIGLADELGVSSRVHFINSYLSLTDTLDLARNSDLVLLPYDSLTQVSSGVLVEALAASRPVVATRFAHATELLASGAGILVDPKDPVAMSRAITRALYDLPTRALMAERSRTAATALYWPNVAAAFRALIDQLVSRNSPRELPGK